MTERRAPGWKATIADAGELAGLDCDRAEARAMLNRLRMDNIEVRTGECGRLLLVGPASRRADMEAAMAMLTPIAPAVHAVLAIGRICRA